MTEYLIRLFVRININPGKNDVILMAGFVGSDTNTVHRGNDDDDMDGLELSLGQTNRSQDKTVLKSTRTKKTVNNRKKLETKMLR